MRLWCVNLHRRTDLHTIAARPHSVDMVCTSKILLSVNVRRTCTVRYLVRWPRRDLVLKDSPSETTGYLSSTNEMNGYLRNLLSLPFAILSLYGSTF